MEWEESNSVMEKVSRFIALNTRGNDYPKEIWLNKDDYKQLYAELQKIQKIYTGHEVLEVPEKRVLAGFRAVYCDGAEIVYSALAKPLPEHASEMNKWVNSCTALSDNK